MTSRQGTREGAMLVESESQEWDGYIEGTSAGDKPLHVPSNFLEPAPTAALPDSLLQPTRTALRC